jgi:hypothetical protein
MDHATGGDPFFGRHCKPTDGEVRHSGTVASAAPGTRRRHNNLTAMPPTSRLIPGTFTAFQSSFAGTHRAQPRHSACHSPPEPWETGFKDTVIAYPGEVTRVRPHFAVGGLFVWHCHIVEHEDNEMMRPFFIGPMPSA